MLKTIRRLLAVIFFIGITALFLDFSGTVQPLFGWMAKLQFLPSVLALSIVPIIIVVGITLLFGRIYCSAICPLGVYQDIVAWIGKQKPFRSNKKAKLANKYSYSAPMTKLRLAVLVLFAALMIIPGFNAIAIIIAPYSAYGRMASTILQPAYIAINNLLADWAAANDSFAFYQVEPHNNPTILIVIAAVSAIILAILAFRNGRTYCNTICPVGTVLGYVAKFSYFKIQVDNDACMHCGLCAKNCKAACIHIEKGQPAVIDYTRCVSCGDCIPVCSKQAIKHAPLKKAAAQATEPTADSGISRRNFLAITGTALAATAVKAQEKVTDGGYAAIADKEIPQRKTPITPPGSLSAKNLQQHCTACQLCISNCPNGVLRPSTDLDHFMQPEVQYEKGYCRPECTRCSDICPAGAIRPISLDPATAEADDLPSWAAKQTIQIGHAVWISKNCLPAAEGIPCGNCARHCPVEAIQMVPMDKDIKMDAEGRCTDQDGNPVDRHTVTFIPAVNTEKCIGCGACENLCPVRPFSAIYVEGHEVHRDI